MTLRRVSRRRFLAGASVVTASAALGAGCGWGDEREFHHLSFGADPLQVADLYLPSGRGPHPVVVLIHGGGWRNEYDRSLMQPLARDLQRQGYAAWNIEYRRVGDAGGGWPGTFDDVATAIDSLASVVPREQPEADLDLDRVAVMGHSSGGHLTAWAAARRGLPEGAPGAGPAVIVRAAFPQAGVFDLRSLGSSALGGGAADLLDGPPASVPERYAVASPIERLPTGVPTVCIHGTGDQIVPFSQSQAFHDLAVAAGDPCELLPVDGANHFDVIDPEHPSWAIVRERLGELLG